MARYRLFAEAMSRERAACAHTRTAWRVRGWLAVEHCADCTWIGRVADVLPTERPDAGEVIVPNPGPWGFPSYTNRRPTLVIEADGTVVETIIVGTVEIPLADLAPADRAAMCPQPTPSTRWARRIRFERATP